MKCIKYRLVTVVFLICSLATFAQSTTEEDVLSLDEGTINNQFQYVLKKSGNFKGTNGEMYEAVKLSMFLTLQAHTLDSLETLHKDLADTKAVVADQSKEISDLKSNLTNTQSDLEKTTAEKDNMSLFGISMSKASYSMVMWFFIAVLLALLLFFIYKFKNSNAVTREAKKNLLEIEEEFEEHRKNALEREQKVRRQLQDEINKQKKTKN